MTRGVKPPTVANAVNLFSLACQLGQASFSLEMQGNLSLANDLLTTEGRLIGALLKEGSFPQDERSRLMELVSGQGKITPEGILEAHRRIRKPFLDGLFGLRRTRSIGVGRPIPPTPLEPTAALSNLLERPVFIKKEASFLGGRIETLFHIQEMIAGMDLHEPPPDAGRSTHPLSLAGLGTIGVELSIQMTALGHPRFLVITSSHDGLLQGLSAFLAPLENPVLEAAQSGRVLEEGALLLSQQGMTPDENVAVSVATLKTKVGEWERRGDPVGRLPVVLIQTGEAIVRRQPPPPKAPTQVREDVRVNETTRLPSLAQALREGGPLSRVKFQVPESAEDAIALVDLIIDNLPKGMDLIDALEQLEFPRRDFEPNSVGGVLLGLASYRKGSSTSGKGEALRFAVAGVGSSLVMFASLIEGPQPPKDDFGSLFQAARALIKPVAIATHILDAYLSHPDWFARFAPPPDDGQIKELRDLNEKVKKAHRSILDHL